jgi:hypothetical protein
MQKIKRYWYGLAVLLFLFPAPLLASVLDSPAVGAIRTGADSIFGWKCTAGTITIRFDAGNPIPALYGGTRADTVCECSDDNNGYVLLWNWSLLTPGSHLIEVFDDGVLFASATFSVISTGIEFLSSVASCTIPNFPEGGDVSTVTWADASQNFQLSEALLAGPKGAPVMIGRWLVTEDFVDHDCNWNTGPAIKLGEDTLILSQNGSALSGTLLDGEGQPGIALSGYVTPAEDFQIVSDPIMGMLDETCLERRTLVFNGNLQSSDGEASAMIEFDLSGSCGRRNSCTWSFIGTLGLLDDQTQQAPKSASDRRPGYLQTALQQQPAHR